MNDTSIYSRLLAGENEEDIVNAFCDEVNAAKARIEKEAEEAAARERIELEQAAAAVAARAKAELEQAAKVNDLSALLLDALKYLRTHYPDLVDKAIDDDYNIEDLARLFVALLDSSSTRVEWGFRAFPNWKWLF